MKRREFSLLIFAAAGLLMAVFALIGAADRLNAQFGTTGYQAVTGVLLEHHVVEVREGPRRHRYFTPRVRYAYTVNGDEYVGVAYAAHRASVDPHWLPRLIERPGYPKNAVAVYYDPRQPGASVLVPSTLRHHLFALGGVFVGLAMAIGFFLGWWVPRRRAKPFAAPTTVAD